ncbi:MAG: hypothetical protein PHC66_01550 [Candidatus Nanoarchaeia archaeon]|nr:hypothetical protein [Candidatus Nanoarchaeia archaeon]MDD5239156.1 hypothetical protein [Candidatus Nanoarchaeia archaeon]
MIELNYEIKRDEKDETKIYSPDTPFRKFNNLVKIEGPNSIGKSTILHLIGLGFYGLKKEGVHKALIKKMNHLLHSERNKIMFNVTITDGNLKLVCKKEDPNTTDIKVYQEINGKKENLSQERFEQEYNLIYDIPNDPTERLKQAPTEIQEAQTRYGNKVGQLREYVNTLITQVRNQKNPAAIKDQTEKVDTLTKNLDGLNKELPDLITRLDLLKKHHYTTRYNYYKTKQEEIDKTVDDLKKQKSKIKRGAEKRSKEYVQDMSELTQILDISKARFDKLTGLLRNLISIKKYMIHLEIFEKINIYDVTRTLILDKNLANGLSTFNVALDELYKKQVDEEKVKESKLYESLIATLQDYSESSIRLPGLKSSISEFITALKKMNEQNKKVVILADNISNSKTLIEDLDKDVSAINSILPKLRKSREAPGNKTEEYSEDEELLKKLVDEKKVIDAKLERYKSEYTLLGKPNTEEAISLIQGVLSCYKSYSEDELDEEINRLTTSISQKTRSQSYTDELLKKEKENLKRMNEAKPHKYYEYLDKLLNIEQVTKTLQSRLLSEFSDYIYKLNSGSVNIAKVSAKEKRYYDEIFDYIGKRIDIVTHINKDYKVKKVDLINEVIITKEGKEISFSDMGTGQSQSAYFKNKLSVPRSDKRKIIALFDEVAMMDKKSLQPILDRIKELHKEKRLLAGIIIKYNDELKIEEF